MKNKLSDLNDHLFAQMERLSDETLTEEQIEQEVKRAGSIIGISDQIISTASLQLKAVDIVAKHGDRFIKQLPMLEGQNTEKAPAFPTPTPSLNGSAPTAN